METYAKRMPMTVALDLVGFPRADRVRVKAWCDHMIALLSGINTPSELRAHATAAMELYRYVEDRVHHARNETMRDDLTGRLLRALVNGEDEAVSEREVTSIILQILIADLTKPYLQMSHYQYYSNRYLRSELPDHRCRSFLKYG